MRLDRRDSADDERNCIRAPARFNVYNESMGGGMGARSHLDGVDGVHVHGTNSANIPVEALESEHPLTVDAYELVARIRAGRALPWRHGDPPRLSPVGHEDEFTPAAR